MTYDMHPRCRRCDSLMIIVGEENGYRIWECPNCPNDESLAVKMS
jgi:DNA-directed RNA polymerase subunit M/transcription elongation factor TFIIS